MPINLSSSSDAPSGALSFLPHGTYLLHVRPKDVLIQNTKGRFAGHIPHDLRPLLDAEEKPKAPRHSWIPATGQSGELIGVRDVNDVMQSAYAPDLVPGMYWRPVGNVEGFASGGWSKSLEPHEIEHRCLSFLVEVDAPGFKHPLVFPYFRKLRDLP